MTLTDIFEINCKIWPFEWISFNAIVVPKALVYRRAMLKYKKILLEDNTMDSEFASR